MTATSHNFSTDRSRVLLVRTAPEHIYATAGPDLGLAYLTTSFSRAGAHVQVLDYLKRKKCRPDFREIIRQFRPTVLGFKAYSQDIPQVNHWAQVAKEEISNLNIIVGGPFPSGLRHLFFEAVNESVDYGLVGEAENAAKPLLKFFETGVGLEKIPGLLSRNGDSSKQNPQDFPANLDSLGIPDNRDMNPADYPTDYEGNTYLPIMTTRGCPYHCTFCSSGMLNGYKIRRRSPESVAEEIQTLNKNFGATNLCIVDDNFTMIKEHAMAICDKLAHQFPWLRWRCPNGLRLDSLDEELLLNMERAGCYEVYVGIQTGSKRIASDMKRGTDMNVLIEQVELIRRKTNFRILGFFIVGYPTEKPEDVRKTIRLSLSLPLEMASFFYFTPHPGTPVFNEYADPRSIKACWSNHHYDSLADFPRYMSPAQIRFWQKYAYIRFFFRPNIIVQLLSRIHSWSQFSRFAQRIISILFDR